MDSALAARSVRNIKTELAFLLDANLLPASKHSEILSILSSTPSLNSTSTPSTNLSSAQASQSQLAHAPLSEKSDPIFSRTNGHTLPPAYRSNTSPVPPPRNNSSAPPAPAELCRAAALYTFAPTDNGDLALAANDPISVTEYTNAEWWKGKNARTGQEGIFPRSYVRVDEASEKRSTGLMPMDVVGASSEQAVGEGQVQQQQQPSKVETQGKKFGKKLGNAAIFGAGATIGSNIVNGIF